MGISQIQMAMKMIMIPVVCIPATITPVERNKGDNLTAKFG